MNNPHQTKIRKSIGRFASVKGPMWVIAVLVTFSSWMYQGQCADGPPPLMSFQTRILDSGGLPIDGPREVVFRIYEFEAGGDVLWAERQSVAVKSGYISVVLGQGGKVDGEKGEPEVDLADLFPGFSDSERYIEVQVGPTPISPRLRLLPTAYSFVSGVALRVVDGGINTGMLQQGSVTSSILAGGAVNSAALADNSVTSAKIVDGTIQAVDLANAAVSRAKIADKAINTSKLDDGSVSGAIIQNAAVVADKLANNAVTSDKIANNAVSSSKIENNAVTSEKIANNAVTSAKLAAMFEWQTFDYSVLEASGTLTFHATSRVVNTGRNISTWVPVLAGWSWGNGNIQTSGGDLGGVRFYQEAGTWRFRVHLQAGQFFFLPNPIVQVLWIPRSMFSSVN